MPLFFWKKRGKRPKKEKQSIELNKVPASGLVVAEKEEEEEEEEGEKRRRRCGGENWWSL